MTGSSDSALALLHSPLTSASAWGEVPRLLREHGYDVVVPEVVEDVDPPYGTRYVAHAALQLRDLLGTSAAVLVGHSGAGPLLPQIGFARQAAGARVDGYVFVDAGLPRAGNAHTRLDLITAADRGYGAELSELLAAGGRFPDWSDADLADEVPDPEDRALLLAGLRPRGLAYFTEDLPLPGDWPEAPVTYLRLSAPYDPDVRIARLRGWPVLTSELGHFAALARPTDVVGMILEALALQR
jgi:pimeloyl-ACP methyl ester carboxylesterase